MTTPIERLRHTVAAYEARHDDDALDLPSGGLTIGDLRQVHDWMEKSEEHLAPRHPAFGGEEHDTP